MKVHFSIAASIAGNNNNGAVPGKENNDFVLHLHVSDFRLSFICVELKN